MTRYFFISYNFSTHFLGLLFFFYFLAFSSNLAYSSGGWYEVANINLNTPPVPSPTGQEIVYVNSTMNISGDFNGAGKIYVWTGPTDNSGGAMFNLEPGANAQNLFIIGAPVGIIANGNNTISNVVMPDILDKGIIFNGDNITVQGSYFANANNEALEVTSGSNHFITNNVFVQSNLPIYSYANNVTITNNKFYNSHNPITVNGLYLNAQATATIGNNYFNGVGNVLTALKGGVITDKGSSLMSNLTANVIKKDGTSSIITDATVGTAQQYQTDTSIVLTGNHINDGTPPAGAKDDFNVHDALDLYNNSDHQNNPPPSNGSNQGTGSTGGNNTTPTLPKSDDMRSYEKILPFDPVQINLPIQIPKSVEANYGIQDVAPPLVVPTGDAPKTPPPSITKSSNIIAQSSSIEYIGITAKIRTQAYVFNEKPRTGAPPLR